MNTAKFTSVSALMTFCRKSTVKVLLNGHNVNNVDCYVTVTKRELKAGLERASFTEIRANKVTAMSKTFAPSTTVFITAVH